jgi:hypothetical protein
MSTKLIATALVVLCVAAMCTLAYAVFDGLRNLKRYSINS